MNLLLLILLLVLIFGVPSLGYCHSGWQGAGVTGGGTLLLVVIILLLFR